MMTLSARLVPLHVFWACSALLLSCRPSADESGTSRGTGATSLSTGAAGEDTADSCPELVSDGDVYVTPESDLSSLQAITVVRGDLNIARLEAVDELSMLRCVRRVEGDLILWSNSSLTSLHGLSRLEAVGGGILVESNSLESLSGLDSLREVSSLAIRSNPRLAHLHLDGLERVGVLEVGYCHGGGPESDGALEGWGNRSLRELGEMSALESVETLRIEWNESLESLEGLLSVVDNGGTIGEIMIRHNQNLPTAEAQTLAGSVGAMGGICGNLGDEDPASCACDPSPP